MVFHLRKIVQLQPMEQGVFYRKRAVKKVQQRVLRKIQEIVDISDLNQMVS